MYFLLLVIIVYPLLLLTSPYSLLLTPYYSLLLTPYYSLLLLTTPHYFLEEDKTTPHFENSGTVVGKQTRECGRTSENKCQTNTDTDTDTDTAQA